MKTLAYIIYAWGSTFLYAALVLWLATVPNLSIGAGSADETVKILYKLVLYGIFFILLYRSIIVTLKNTVSRLSSWRSKQEKIEDAQFVLIIETLVTIICVLALTIFAIVDEFIQAYLNIANRTGEVRDVLVSLMGILLTAIIVYSSPVIGELEVALKQKFTQLLKNFKK